MDYLSLGATLNGDDLSEIVTSRDDGVKYWVIFTWQWPLRSTLIRRFCQKAWLFNYRNYNREDYGICNDLSTNSSLLYFSSKFIQ